MVRDGCQRVVHDGNPSSHIIGKESLTIYCSNGIKISMFNLNISKDIEAIINWDNFPVDVPGL